MQSYPGKLGDIPYCRQQTALAAAPKKKTATVVNAFEVVISLSCYTRRVTKRVKNLSAVRAHPGLANGSSSCAKPRFHHRQFGVLRMLGKTLFAGRARGAAEFAGLIRTALC